MAGYDDPTDEVVERLRALAREPLPPESRDRHLRTIRTALADTSGAPVPPRRRPARRSGLRRRLVTLTAAALALLLVSSGGAVAAAQSAGPDDVLYGVKRTSEQVWLVLPRDAEGRAQAQLAVARRRADEAVTAPEHAPRLIAEGMANVEEAEDALPEEAIETFLRLLGDGEDALPPQASPRARAAIHRNCVRIATKHDLGPERCGPAPEVEHPGRGGGRETAPGQQRDRGEPGARGKSDERRGWGPGGRPEGVEGPPPGTPGKGQEEDEGGDEGGDEGEGD